MPEQILGGGASPVFEGISLAMMLPSTPGRCRAIVVVTNGLDGASASRRRLMDVAKRTDASVFVAFAKTYGFELDDVLAKTTDLTGGAVLETKSVADGVAQAFDVIRNGYVLSYTPTDRSVGWHDVLVELPAALQYDVRWRRGYFRNKN